MLHGTKRSGKDFSATMMQNLFKRLNVNTEIIAFAKPMKEIIATTLDITENQLEEFKNNPDNYTVHILNGGGANGTEKETDCRKILQNFGSEAMKSVFGNDIWAMLALQKVQDSLSPFIIISDFRFDIEYETFKRALGNNLITIEILGTPNTDTHISEQRVSNVFEYTIDNSRKDDTLRVQLDKIVKDICNEN